ncbi:hypothetical protein IAT38_005932 [Cryptococcus sp. DSM 104549]
MHSDTRLVPASEFMEIAGFDEVTRDDAARHLSFIEAEVSRSVRRVGCLNAGVEVISSGSCLPLDHLNGMVFVLDGTDYAGLWLAQDEIAQIVQDKRLADVPLVFFVTRQCWRHALTVQDVESNLHAASLFANRQWRVLGLDIETGCGVVEALKGMFECLKMK